ncbi:methionine synthase I [Paenibacillus sp. 1011MAR3C5]|uniref:methionine synthase I n=1 Tax=Paenibacillus sp. 1011MAR3C5 TaxID=1675787 RepID=UPI000E6CC629|nr:methionine synthase I [Paenibacillus sp. 1011MAR3C5]RJE87632.1 methionine synthase I [Paenibacillus sp. 1011MAR3C5]
MDWYQRHIHNLTSVFREAQSRISHFPRPLDDIGNAYADKYNPLDDSDKGKDYICVLLPYWMQEITGISDEQSDRLALANIYGMLYFFILDDVMDSTQIERVKSQLSLASLLQLEMHALFRELFPSESPFWTYYDRYVISWADCVVNEAEADFFIHDPIRTAGKAGPVKISAVGACLLAGCEERIGEVEQSIDLALMTLQMLDDWADWQEDMMEGSYNGLLAMIASETGTPLRSLSKEAVQSQIYVLGCMNRYAEIANRNHDSLMKLGQRIPAIVEYHDYMVSSLRDIAAGIETAKRKALGGGINFFT